MTLAARHSLSLWKFRHSVVVWIGVLLNLSYCVPLLVAPTATMNFFGITIDASPFWPRLVGGLLILISTFYVPMTFDLDRYRVFAWISIFPSRSFGATYLFIAVLAFGYSAGFLIPALIDGGTAIASLWCLFRIVRIEQEIGAQRGAT
jgi:hypothetical protein